MSTRESAPTRDWCGEPSDHSSIQALYDRHNGWLVAWLRRRLGGHTADAEDLAQDTFVRCLRSPAEVATLREPRSYLLTIARGLTVDLFRRRTLERQYLEALAALPEPVLPSEESHAVILETLVELDRMFDGLGATVKQTFILSQLEGLTYAQIAERLGISLRSVNNYMARAMEHCCLFRLERGV